MLTRSIVGIYTLDCIFYGFILRGVRLNAFGL